MINRLLTKFSHIFKFDAHYVFKGMFWLGLGQFFSSLFSFVLIIILARYLSQEVYGNYKYLISIIGVVGAFSLTGLYTSVAQSVSKQYDGTLMYAFRTNLKWSIIPFLIYNLVGLYYFVFEKNLFLSIPILIISILQPLIDSFLLYNSHLQAKMKFVHKVFISTAIGFSNLVVLSVVSYYSDDLVLIILLSLFTSFVLNLFAFKYVIRNFCSNNLITPETILYGKYWSILNLFGQISLQMDKILTFNILGPTSLAIYSVATGPVSQLRSLGKFIGALALPKMTNQEYYLIKKNIWKKMFLIFIFALIIFIFYFIFASLIYKIFFPNYLEAVKYSKIFALVLLVMPAVLIRQALVGHMKKKALTIIAIFIPVIKISLLSIFVPIFGIWGAIYAVLASEFLNLILYFYFFKRSE